MIKRFQDFKQKLINNINSFSKEKYFYKHLSKEEQDLVLNTIGSSLGEHIYNFVYNNIDYPKCICGKPLKFKSFKEGYLQYCSLSCKSKYQVRHFSSYLKMKETYKQTCLQRYGVENVFQISSVQQQIAENYSVTHNRTSKFENEISNFLISNNYKIERNTRKIISPKELDIFIPSLNIAIECNGNYWHSIHHTNHFIKLQLCELKDIKLVQIMELDFYQHKKDILNNLLRLLQGLPYLSDFYIFHNVDGFLIQDAFWPCENFLSYIPSQKRNYKGNDFLDAGYYILNSII